MVSEEHVTAFGWANTQDIDEMLQYALRTNDFLTGLFLGVGLRLVDFKLEFGRLWDDEEMRIVLADEIRSEERVWGKSVSVRVDLGGRSIIKKKKKEKEKKIKI